VLEHLGHRSWFAWSLNNWGTDQYPWNVNVDTSSIDLGHVTITFQTAWCGPYPIMKRLRELFPDIAFKHDWDEIDTHLGVRIKIGRPGVTQGDFLSRARFPEE